MAAIYNIRQRGEFDSFIGHCSIAYEGGEGLLQLLP